MDDTPEIIRQQMRETKIQLSEKLKLLEKQVADTVQSTGTAMNSMSAVDNAVQCVSKAFDFRRQINRHPWLVIGGAVALGYLAVRFIKGSATKSIQMPAKELQPTPITDISGQESKSPSVVSSNAATAAAIASQNEKSSSHQFSDVAIGALIGVMEGVAASAVPRIVDYLTGDPATARTNGSENAGEKQDPPRRSKSTEPTQQLHIAPSSNVRSRRPS